MAKSGSKTAASSDNRDRRVATAADEPRDSEGRFTQVRRIKLSDVKVPEITARNAALGALGAGITVGVAVAGNALFKVWNDRKARADETSPAGPMIAVPGDDAPRPTGASDAIDADKREAFAPATLPVPSRVEAMGNGDD